jgi:integrase
MISTTTDVPHGRGTDRRGWPRVADASSVQVRSGEALGHERQVALPAYRVHKAKGVGYVRLAGRMVYLGRAGTDASYEKYRRTIAHWLATGEPPQASSDTAKPAPDVAQVAAAYLRWARTYYLDPAGRPSSGIGPAEAAAKCLVALYGSTPAAAFGPLALRALQGAMVRANLCRNVVNQRVTCVKRLFRWAVAQEMVPAEVIAALAAVEPLRRGRSGARETPPVRPVPHEHVDAVLPYLPPTLAAMVQVQRLTGMRSGELCVMRSCDIDVSGAVWVYRPASHKTAYRGHDRAVLLGPRVQEILGALLDGACREAYLFSPQRAIEERRQLRSHNLTRTMSTTEVIRRYGPRSYHRALRYAMRAANRAGALPKEAFWHPHQLRHRYATDLRRTKGLEAARLLLGHRTLAQTLEYAQADGNKSAAVVAELG